jgi:hypothetical protein
VSGYLQDGLVHVTTTATMPVPVTGTPQGDLYGGERSGWFTVAPGQPLVQQAPSARTVARSANAVAAAPRAKAPARKLRMTRVRMTPRRFAVSHRRTARRRRSHATDGTTITWVLNQPAAVRITVRKVGRNGRTTMVRSFTRKGIQGENTARYSGRVGRKLLRPGRYRLTITATMKGQHTAPRSLPFTVVKG